MKDLVNHVVKNIAQVTVGHIFQIDNEPIEQFNGNHLILGTFYFFKFFYIGRKSGGYVGQVDTTILTKRKGNTVNSCIRTMYTSWSKGWCILYWVTAWSYRQWTVMEIWGFMVYKLPNILTSNETKILN